MSRFLSTLRWDVVVQFRQGLYYAGVFVVLIWVFLLAQLPEDAVAVLLPYVIFMDLSVFAFYFMAGILYLEKGEGVLAALVLTPLRRWEYLSSKMMSLTLMTLMVTIVVVLIAWGWRLNWLLLLVGVGLNCWMLTLIGFTIAARYNGISEFLIPSMLYMIPSQLPALTYFGISDSWLFYLVPTQPTMLLMAGAFHPLATWQLVYSFGYLALSILVVTWLAQRAFDRFIVRNESR